MLKKFTLSIFIFLFALLALEANAQTEAATEKQTAVKELIGLINADNRAEEIVNLLSIQMDSLRETTIESILEERTDLTPDEKKSLRQMLLGGQKEATKRFRDKLMQKLNYNEMINEISAAVYDKYFTLEEIKDLIIFYKTPTGQKYLKTMTPLIGETMKLTQERIVPKIPIVLKEIQDEEKREIERQINAKKPKTKKAELN